MQNLKEIQKNFAKDIIDNNQLNGSYLDSNKFTATELMNIYSNNYFLSLIDALAASYSCVKRLVGKDFFNHLTKQYILKEPPKMGYLKDYGDNFASFIARFKACGVMPYLADIAKFERLYEVCYHDKDKTHYFYSVYPILDIWQLDDKSDNIDLTSGEQYIQISKQNNKVVIKLIKKEQFLLYKGEGQ